MTLGSVSVSGRVASICFHRHRLPAAPQPPSTREADCVEYSGACEDTGSGRAPWAPSACF